MRTCSRSFLLRLRDNLEERDKKSRLRCLFEGGGSEDDVEGDAVDDDALVL